MTILEARAEAIRLWVGTSGSSGKNKLPAARADQVKPGRRVEWPIVKGSTRDGFRVGYSWATPYSNYMSGRAYDHVMGRGGTLEEAFQQATRRKTYNK